MKKLILAAAVIGFLVSASTGPVFAVPVQWSGNGHWYDIVTVSPGVISWEDAQVAAAGMTFMGLLGHLATITSQDEQDFIFGSFGSTANDHWLGGFQPPGSPEPGGGWQWVTGELFIYTNWVPGEPNNAGGTENALQIYNRSDGRWNDVTSGGYLGGGYLGYIVEFSEPVPEPGTLLLLGSGLAGLAGRAWRRRRESFMSNGPLS